MGDAIKKTAVMHQAWTWCCDECGENNFEFAVVQPASDEVASSFRDYIGDSDGEDWKGEGNNEFGLMMSGCKSEVICKHCKTSYRTVLEGSDEEDMA